MSLLALWENSREVVRAWTLSQIVSAAGDGKLADNSACSMELREFFSKLGAEELSNYLEYCLSNALDKGGLILQDLVNELGRQLDYHVEHGLYQGRKGKIGFDGIWQAPDGHAIVIEVKTTDAYRINLDTIADYRNRLIAEGRINHASSILIVVGRQDTGDLEAQIRGSRHAWDVRVISADALVKLVAIKMESDEDQTIERIRNLLKPVEYTRLDSIIEALFIAAQDVRNDEDDPDIAVEDEISGTQSRNGQQRTPQPLLDSLRERVRDSVAKHIKRDLLKHKRTQYWTADKQTRVVLATSKYHKHLNSYWFAFHPHQRDFLASGEEGFFVLGCMEHQYAYALPYKALERELNTLYITERPNDKTYWHIRIEQNSEGEMYLLRKKEHDHKHGRIDMKQYAILLSRD